MKILLTGGGTAGSVSPLLAVYSTLLRQGHGGQGLQQIDSRLKKSDVLWLGTNRGPERKMVGEYGIRFKPIFAGKMRRYFDLRNLWDIARIKLAFFQSIFIILKFKPDIILSAGSFVSVPVVWAGWMLGCKSLIHQQDIKPGLANKLMAPFATKITVTFRESLACFPREKTVWTGNPVREEILQGDRERAFKRFGLERGVLTLLVTCGGTGSVVVNEVVVEALDELVEFCQVVHITAGKSKIPAYAPPCGASAGRQNLPLRGITRRVTKSKINPNDKIQKRYCPVEFLDGEGMAEAYAVADLVVSRCGLSTMTELSALGKPTIFIPLGDTHQEDNAKLILEKKSGLVIWQKDLTLDKFVIIVKDILSDDKRRAVLSTHIIKIMPRGGAGKMVDIIDKL